MAVTYFISFIYLVLFISFRKYFVYFMNLIKTKIFLEKPCE